MVLAASVDGALRQGIIEAEAPPLLKMLRIVLPQDLRRVMMPDLAENIWLSPGRLEITAHSAVRVLQSLALMAQTMRNDLETRGLSWSAPQPHRPLPMRISSHSLKLQASYVMCSLCP